ncbi:MAG: LysR family transcriptional regulator [Halioglobus sp.]|nr:LysR family transcriptional regulator [Halioglobus sp.]|tara:strand:- start:428 stop:1327 length:900 start_codon:yes stop_codon:yes gene_type:complete
MINPVLLRSFTILVETGHFTRTAERLHMTQSGVSQHIRKLEQQLGQDLIVRQGKQFHLTDAGNRLYQEGRNILYKLAELEQDLRTESADVGEIRLMSPGSVGLKLYPQLLDLQSENPGLSFDYRFAPNASVEAAILEMETDIGLMTSHSNLQQVQCKAIGRENLLLVTSSAMGEPGWEQLLQAGFIDHPDGAHHASLLLSANYPEFEHHTQFATRGFCNQIGLILEPVSRGLGFTVLPDHAIRAFPNPQLVKAHPLANPVSEPLYLVTNRSRPLPARAVAMIDRIEAWLQVADSRQLSC